VETAVANRQQRALRKPQLVLERRNELHRYRSYRIVRVRTLLRVPNRRRKALLTRTNRYKIETCAVVGAFDGRSVAVKLHEQTLLVPYRGAALDGAVRGSCQPNAAGFREGAVRSA